MALTPEGGHLLTKGRLILIGQSPLLHGTWARAANLEQLPVNGFRNHINSNPHGSWFISCKVQCPPGKVVQSNM